ncbi:RNA 3'-terminal phosphate cyclase [Natronomonas sp. EA1]|uniref:RNA 3'-terminal phosphate cyclase n=1 Tax=Natronomonas sp. EA1 TaxID=3421655 RepID=UPI003EBC02C4
MHTIDGGAGGGQLLRTSLALAACRGEAIRVRDIRGSRDSPGLRPQHLAGVRLLAEITDADVRGAEQGSTEIRFDPGAVRSGDYEIDIGTAGAITLLFDTVLPLATAIDEPLSVTATGGTDVRWSPPIDYFEHVKLPVVRSFGLEASVSVERRGFYPAGGGTATLELRPSELSPLACTERGPLKTADAYAVAEQRLADADVAGRLAARASERLREAGIEVQSHESVVDARSAGAALTLVFTYDHPVGFTALGEKGVPAEAVADDAVDAALAFHERDAVVDAHLADQLVLFLALAGGEVRLPERTDHVATSLRLLRGFGYELEEEDGVVRRESA